jgi:hypothetical protein
MFSRMWANGLKKGIKRYTVSQKTLHQVNTSSGLDELEINPVLDALMKY